jgi:hypothetical protein
MASVHFIRSESRPAISTEAVNAGISPTGRSRHNNDDKQRRNLFLSRQPIDSRLLETHGRIVGTTRLTPWPEELHLPAAERNAELVLLLQPPCGSWRYSSAALAPVDGLRADCPEAAAQSFRALPAEEESVRRQEEEGSDSDSLT